MDKFGEYGLRDDEDLEYFTFVKADGNKIFIPKRNKVFYADGGSTKTKEYIKIF